MLLTARFFRISVTEFFKMFFAYFDQITQYPPIKTQTRNTQSLCAERRTMMLLGEVVFSGQVAFIAPLAPIVNNLSIFPGFVWTFPHPPPSEATIRIFPWQPAVTLQRSATNCRGTVNVNYFRIYLYWRVWKGGKPHFYRHSSYTISSREKIEGC